MQSLDAGEIEANAKLAGLTDVQQSDYEKWVTQGDKDVKLSTIKLSMIRPEKVELTNETSTVTVKTGVKKLIK
jgi:hypothetical protein